MRMLVKNQLFGVNPVDMALVVRGLMFLVETEGQTQVAVVVADHIIIQTIKAEMAAAE
jgi:hypothetical protein